MAPSRPVNHLLFHERRNFGNQKTIREIKRRNFGNQKIIREIKRRNSGNQKIIREIKRTRQESKHIIILVILLEHRTSVIQKNNGTVTLTRQDFLTNRGYRAGFDVYIKYYCDILLVSRLERLNENAVSRRHGSS